MWPLVSSSESVSRNQGKSYRMSYDLASDVRQHHFLPHPFDNRVSLDSEASRQTLFGHLLWVVKYPLFSELRRDDYFFLLQISSGLVLLLLLLVLGIILRTSHMLGKLSTTELYSHYLGILVKCMLLLSLLLHNRFLKPILLHL